MNLKNVYLLLTIVGALIPYVFFVQFFAAEGSSLGTFIPALFANGAAGGFSADLLITSITFWIFLFAQRTPRIWAYIAVNLVIGLSCAVPAYLYVQERSREEQRSPDVSAHARAGER